jgi:DNA-binding CsgD family transcriptional regulator
MEGMPELFLPVAHGGMAIGNASANALFQQAIVQNRHDLVVRSIPVPAKEDRPALVVHMLPLRRAAHDIFSGADILVAATAVSASAMVPSPNILTGLFDLTPAEAKLATALTRGQSLKAAAAGNGVTFSTARTYLDRIYRKTGANQQSQLVALLKSVQPFQSPK